MDRPTVEDLDQQSPDRDDRIAALVVEYQAMRATGNGVDRATFLIQHAEFAAELGPCLEAIDFVGRIVPAIPQEKATSSKGVLEGTTLGDFQVIKMIGSGGMGEVYEAEQISLHRKVALKVLPAMSSLDERALKRFRHEAQAVAILQHPHIVPIYSVGSEGNTHYFAMQFIEGKSLAEIVSTWQRNGRSSSLIQPVQNDSTSKSEPAEIGSRQRSDAKDLPTYRLSLINEHEEKENAIFRRVAELFAHAAEALQHAHEVGIVHRDIKPGNLLVDDHGDVWIADFGLAKLPDSNLTATTDFMGTLRYMSPEQASGKAVTLDGRTDIYSLGVTLYETLTLQPAFQADDRRMLIKRVLDEDPRPLRSVCADIPMDLETITLKAMSKVPEERYLFASEMAEDLRRFLSDRPIQAKPQSFRQKSSKWMKRNRVTLGVTAATTFLFMTLGSIGLLYGLLAMDRQRRDLKIAMQREGELLKEANGSKAEAVQRLESEKTARASEQRIAYLQSVSLAYIEWQSGNMEAAEAWLMRCPPPLRDWEWRYVQRLCHQELNVLAIGSDSVHDIACPPSGELLICEEGSVSLRSIPDGSEKSRWPLPLGETPRQRVTISENGKFLVSTVGKNIAPRTAARIFESRSGKLVFEIADVGIVRELDMSPTSTHAISRGDDRKLRIWDIRSKALVKEIPMQTVTNVSFSPDGSCFAVGSVKKSINIFNTETGELLRSIPEPTLLRSGVVTVSHSLRYSPDGRSIAVCLDGGGIQIYDSTTGTSIRNWKTPLRQVIDCAYSPDGLWLALMDDADRTIQIWNVDTGERINRMSLRSLTPQKLQFSSDGMILVGFTGAATVSLWDLSSAHVGSQLGKIPRNHSYPGQQYAPCHVRVSPSGKLAALYSGHRIDLYEPKDHRFRRTLVAPSSDQVTRGIVFDEAKGVLYQLTHGAILSWDLEKGSVVQTLPISASFSSFDKGFFPEEKSDRGLATYSPQLPFLGNNGQYLWVDSTRTSQKGEGERYLFTSTWLTGERSEVPFFAPFKGRVYALASSDDGQRMVAALNGDKELICLNAEPGQKSWNIATPHRILSMKFASRGDRLGVADARGNLRILETETGKLASALAVPIQERLQFAFSPDADRIAIAVGRSFDEEGEVRVCDVESGQTLIKIPLDSAAESVEFTPDGLQLLATDHKGRLWTFDSVPRSLSEKIEEVQEKRVGWHLDRVAEAESSNNYRAAVWHMDQLLALQPEDASLESRRASLLSKTGDFAHLEASELERMERTLTLKSLSTAYRLSAEYIARRDSASHQRLCRRLFEIVGPQTKPYDASQIYRLGMFCPDGVADLQAYIRLCEERFSDGSSDSQFAALFILGGAHYRAGHWSEAKTKLTEILAQNRRSSSIPIAWLFLAMVEKKLGNDGLATEAFETAEKKYAEVAASRKNGEPNIVVDFHYPLLKEEYKALRTQK